MRSFWMLALFAAALTSTGCDGGGTGTGGGGAGGAGGSGGGATTTSSTTTLNCDGLIENPNACGLCVEGQCCAALQDCLQDDACSVCFDPLNEDPACETNALIQTLQACITSSCSDDCVTGSDPVCDAPEVAPSMGACVVVDGTDIKCNPITNEGCDTAAGEACDGTMVQGFQCFPDGNTQAVCEPCGDADGYCLPGATCVGQCAKFCCDDGDCGTGTCKKGDFGDPDVGYCAVAAM